jgi:hypothetical protein
MEARAGAPFTHQKRSVAILPAQGTNLEPDWREPVTHPTATFGRRSAPGRARPLQDNTSSAPGDPKPTPGGRSRVPLGKLLLITIPSTVALFVLMALVIRPAPSTSASSSGSECRSKKAAGGIFDIDWCQAGRAALQGVAGGAGARR